MEFVLKELIDQVMTARAAQRPVYIRGGGTKDFYGESGSLDKVGSHSMLDMSVYRGVVSYQPSELVITVRAGTPLCEVEHVLDAQNQMLAFEPPRFGAASTIGGCVAAGLSGPRRMAAGSLRDFVLGARLLDSSGAELDFGGEVMKNVAGYDVSRLLTGSMGIFGALTQISLKVVPKPFVETTRSIDIDEAGALTLFNQWRSRPLPVSATAWCDDPQSGSSRLWVRLSGSGPAVEAGIRAVGGQVVDTDDADSFWNSLRDQTHSFFQTPTVWRLALPPHSPAAGLGSTLIEWNGGQRWLATATATDPARVRERAIDLGGYASLFRSQLRPAGMTAFHPLGEGLMGISRRLKHALDPVGIFNPKRLFSEF